MSLTDTDHQATVGSTAALRLTLLGQVQGIGYRPALARLAEQLDLHGWVANTPHGVQVHVEGQPDKIRRFTELCTATCPEGGHVADMLLESAPPSHTCSFHIVEHSLPVNLRTSVPVDRVVCGACRQEIANTDNHRYGYWLTSCSQCGPRYSIIETMPYERFSSSMAAFEMCDVCQREYQCSSDRRFHAQTTCCPRCGPSLTGLDQSLACLQSGGILGVKGLGGYQLIVDASDDLAVKRLRTCKGRPAKPLAVMVADLEAARKLAILQPDDEVTLAGPAGPIVICQLRSPQVGSQTLPESITCGLGSLGIMLPTTPLHVWLAAHISPLVVTSANVESQPILYGSLEELDPEFPLADHWIDHDRTIRRPIDDSVVQNVGSRQVTVRSARGLAPLSLPIPERLLRHQVVAVGGHQKVALALCNGYQAVLGPHMGDMVTTQSRRRLIQQIDDCCTLYGCRPTVVVHDCHPDYFTTQWAREVAARQSLRLVAVQHHHAHIASGMLEAGWCEQQVLGLAWDGTGLGTDTLIWGGETLVASLSDFKRVASLRPFQLPGGEIAISEPWRIAAAMISEVQRWDGSFQAQPFVPATSRGRATAWLADSPSTVWSTSMGRLFDAVAALVLPGELGCQSVGYEGHFAALLETLCDPAATGHYPLPIHSMELAHSEIEHELDWRPMMRAVVCDLQHGLPRSAVAMRFHRTIARLASQIHRLFPELPMVLAGGVFQNRVLLQLMIEDLESSGIALAIPSKIPINDGGLAAGQLAVALAQVEATACA
ncbi:MAG: carbamoyltransferase HypF [Pirellulaceae bacterium]|nr:carbamoyltransferase HypF [Pirellulaceae bacterium]